MVWGRFWISLPRFFLSFLLLLEVLKFFQNSPEFLLKTFSITSFVLQKLFHPKFNPGLNLNYHWLKFLLDKLFFNFPPFPAKPLVLEQIYISHQKSEIFYHKIIFHSKCFNIIFVWHFMFSKKIIYMWNCLTNIIKYLFN